MPPLFRVLVHQLDSSQNFKSTSQLDNSVLAFLTYVFLRHRRSMPRYPGAHSDASEWTCCETKHEKKQNENSWFCSAHQTLHLNIFSVTNLCHAVPPSPLNPFQITWKKKALGGQLAAFDFLGANSAAWLRIFGDASTSRLATCRPFGALRVFAHLDCAFLVQFIGTVLCDRSFVLTRRVTRAINWGSFVFGSDECLSSSALPNQFSQNQRRPVNRSAALAF